jgi:tRNA (mo5U34)-methyltransferase
MTSLPPLYATLTPLARFKGQFDATAVVAESRKIWQTIQRSPHWSQIHRDLKALVHGVDRHLSSSTVIGDGIETRLPDRFDYEALEKLCASLISWRTGPYTLGSFHIDTEWRSHMKWSRIAPLIPQRPGMRIADVGCSNGYFMHKLATLQPDITVGFDPIERCWLQFALIQSFVRTPNLAFVPMGILSLEAFQGFFDFILCMGVLYHQRDHALAVRRLFDATRSGGHVLLESLVVPSDKPLVIEPRDRYAKMRNAWVIPSANHLRTLFAEAGFTEVSVHSFGPLSTNEQRATKFAPYESLADFLDPNDPTRTIEGHPAPHTAAVIGKKV